MRHRSTVAATRLATPYRGTDLLRSHQFIYEKDYDKSGSRY